MLGAGETFADYLVEGVLGQGGMGTVYRARHPRLPRLVALKLLHRAVSEDEELRRRFIQEANVVARLEHPGIVGIYDRGTQDGHLWISMQYVDGTDAARLDARALPPGQIVQIITETGEALDYAHSRGVLHRDIKPANILLAPRDSGRGPRAVLTDFGIARLLDADTKMTSTGTFTATLAYASPEQLSGETVDHRADQYSLACTLFTLLAGQTPFPATNPGQIVAGHLAKPVPRLSAVRPDLPPPVDEVIARAMAKQRHERFGSCSEFAAAATAALHGRASGPVRRPAPTLVNSRPEPARPAAPVSDPRERLAPTRLGQPNPVGRPADSPYPTAMSPMSPVAAPTVARPSARTSVMAALISMLLGLFVGLSSNVRWFLFWGVARFGGFRYETAEEIGLVLVAGLAGVLVVGAIMLLLRWRLGRLAVVAGTAVVTLGAGARTIMGATEGSDASVTLMFIGVLALSLTALGCALSRSTARWLARS